jgi:hypothetical protein
VIDEGMADFIRVTVIATGFPNDNYIDEDIFNSQRSVLASAKEGIMGRNRPIIDSRRNSSRMGASFSPNSSSRTRIPMQTRDEAPSQASNDRTTSESLAHMTLSNIMPSAPTVMAPTPSEIHESKVDVPEKPMPMEPKFDFATPTTLPTLASVPARETQMETNLPLMGMATSTMPFSSTDHGINFADEINRSIDDALNLADTISMQNKEAIDNLDIPTFLRNEIKNLNL